MVYSVRAVFACGLIEDYMQWDLIGYCSRVHLGSESFGFLTKTNKTDFNKENSLDIKLCSRL